jgi:Zn-dependent peptidase ImmA (M78 family)
MLAAKDIDRIEKTAEETLQEVFGDDLNALMLPVNINELLESNNLELEKVFFQDPDVSGSFERASNRIRINVKDPAWRQAFTAAHELGHYRLHSDADVETLYRMDLPKAGGMSQLDDREQQANWFAASLLMPKPLVIKFWGLTRDVSRLAEIFGVSISAMQFRLKNLGLI